MRFISMTLFCALLFALQGVSSTALAAEATHSNRTDSVAKTIDHFLYGASVNDKVIHGSFWAEDLTYTSSSGIRFGREQLMSGMQDAVRIPDDEVNSWYSAENLEVKWAGDAAIVNFTLVATAIDGTRQEYLNSGVLVERDGRWQAMNWNATHKANPTE
ncbi:nuclear transport factor 2 family protein [Pseudidiomarina aestuarii]|uniref:Nuclear transport factor 2 family protein n=1 Tax=Pseudidiomarina aestuarii TaxID=624146 RepID=A0A7Z6ZSE4_9GAMM|nr:nuclear transport factor 2 family protein [Pseudidiomarina aestuarii]RUO39470.1 nuclear transport factor 2 family protein [Pseudidiomarina aestuarii]